MSIVGVDWRGFGDCSNGKYESKEIANHDDWEDGSRLEQEE